MTPGISAFQLSETFCRTKDLGGAYSSFGQDPSQDLSCVLPIERQMQEMARADCLEGKGDLVTELAVTVPSTSSIPER